MEERAGGSAPGIEWQTVALMIACYVIWLLTTLSFAAGDASAESQ